MSEEVDLKPKAFIKAILCPICGNRARATHTRYGIRHSCCDLWSWGYAPLVDAATHEARKAAHRAYDQLWKTKRAKRRDCYAALAQIMCVNPKHAHIAQFTVHQCQTLLVKLDEVEALARNIETDRAVTKALKASQAPVLSRQAAKKQLRDTLAGKEGKPSKKAKRVRNKKPKTPTPKSVTETGPNEDDNDGADPIDRERQ